MFLCPSICEVAKCKCQNKIALKFHVDHLANISTCQYVHTYNEFDRFNLPPLCTVANCSLRYCRDIHLNETISEFQHRIFDGEFEVDLCETSCSNVFCPYIHPYETINLFKNRMLRIIRAANGQKEPYIEMCEKYEEFKKTFNFIISDDCLNTTVKFTPLIFDKKAIQIIEKIKSKNLRHYLHTDNIVDIYCIDLHVIENDFAVLVMDVFEIGKFYLCITDHDCQSNDRGQCYVNATIIVASDYEFMYILGLTDEQRLLVDRDMRQRCKILLVEGVASKQSSIYKKFANSVLYDKNLLQCIANFI